MLLWVFLLKVGKQRIEVELEHWHGTWKQFAWSHIKLLAYMDKNMMATTSLLVFVFALCSGGQLYAYMPVISYKSWKARQEAELEGGHGTWKKF